MNYESEKWKVGNVKWEMGSEKRTAEIGKWKMKSERRISQPWGKTSKNVESEKLKVESGESNH